MTALALVILAACPTHASWPTTDWPVQLSTRTDAIKVLEDYAFTLTGQDSDRLGLRTDGLVIVKNGTIVYEKYARGWGQNNRHISWSVAKSFSTMMVGVAAQKGLVRPGDSICKYVLPIPRDELCALTVQNLMEFGSGMHWQEGYENDPYQTSSVISMLLGVGHNDFVAFTMNEKKEAPPNTVWEYSTGEAGVVAAIANNAASPSLGKDWMWTELFNKIGMNRTIFEGDLALNPAGGSYVFATPRDFARFGYLYLNDGCWANERLLPDGWVKSSTTMSGVFASSAAVTETEPNGWMWWLNQVPPKVGTKPWVDSPDDAFVAIGHWGQYVVVVPSQDLVIVRTGDDRDESNSSIDINKLITFSMAVAQ